LGLQPDSWRANAAMYNGGTVREMSLICVQLPKWMSSTLEFCTGCFEEVYKCAAWLIGTPIC
jgi:hypothetical protein